MTKQHKLLSISQIHSFPRLHYPEKRIGGNNMYLKCKPEPTTWFLPVWRITIRKPIRTDLTANRAPAAAPAHWTHLMYLIKPLHSFLLQTHLHSTDKAAASCPHHNHTPNITPISHVRKKFLYLPFKRGKITPNSTKKSNQQSNTTLLTSIIPDFQCH